MMNRATSILVCGEALMDVFADGQTPTGFALDARIGGSPLNVAIGLARLGQQVGFLGGLSSGFLGERLRQALQSEGVDLRHAQSFDAPTTISLVGLNALGVPSYAFYGEGCADPLVVAAKLGPLDAGVRALHFGSYTMVVEPVASAHRALIEREHASRIIAFDPNIRLNVEADRDRWTSVVDWMVRRTHLVKVSDEDLQLLYPGVPIRDVVKNWLARGVRLVTVTCGNKGALAFTDQHSVDVEAAIVRVVDTVGAGDTFQAALLTWLSERDALSTSRLQALSAAEIHAALVFATRASGVTCARRGADLPRRDELR